MKVTVERAAKGDAVVIDHGLAIGVSSNDVVLGELGDVHRQGLLEPGSEAEHLEAAGISEGRAGPIHEPSQPASLVDEVWTRLQEQMVGISQHCLGSQLRHGLRQQGLDGGLGPDDDEGRGLDGAVWCVDDAGAPAGVVKT